MQWVLQVQEFRLWVCWQQRRSLPLPPLPQRTEEQIFWRPRCPASGPLNMGWHSAGRQIKEQIKDRLNLDKNFLIQSEIHIEKRSLHISSSEFKSTLLPLGVNLRGFDVVSEIILQRKEENQQTLFLLFGPPFSFWYKSSLFWKKMQKNSFQTLNHVSVALQAAPLFTQITVKKLDAFKGN